MSDRQQLTSKKKKCSNQLKANETSQPSQGPFATQPSVSKNGNTASSTDLNSINENILEEFEAGAGILQGELLANKSLDEQYIRGIQLEEDELSEITHKSWNDQEMLKLIQELGSQKPELKSLYEPFISGLGDLSSETASILMNNHSQMLEFPEHEDLDSSNALVKREVQNFLRSKGLDDHHSQQQQHFIQNEIFSRDLGKLCLLIQSDMFRCQVCNQKYSLPGWGKEANQPRVLYCGDSVCEKCIGQSIMPASVKIHSKGQKLEAAKQITCLVCNNQHMFKLTKSGFIMGNDQYIKVRDERGLVNYFGNKVKKLESYISPFDLLRQESSAPDGGKSRIQVMDSSVDIPQDLIIRSLPLNVELIALLKKKEAYFPSLVQEDLPAHHSNTQIVDRERDQSADLESDVDTEQEIDSNSYEEELEEEEEEDELDENYPYYQQQFKHIINEDSKAFLAGGEVQTSLLQPLFEQLQLKENEELKETINQLVKQPQVKMKKGLEDSIEQKLKQMLEKKKQAPLSLNPYSKSSFKKHNQLQHKQHKGKDSLSQKHQTPVFSQVSSICYEEQRQESFKKVVNEDQSLMELECTQNKQDNSGICQHCKRLQMLALLNSKTSHFKKDVKVSQLSLEGKLPQLTKQDSSSQQMSTSNKNTERNRKKRERKKKKNKQMKESMSRKRIFVGGFSFNEVEEDDFFNTHIP